MIFLSDVTSIAVIFLSSRLDDHFVYEVTVVVSVKKTKEEKGRRIKGDTRHFQQWAGLPAAAAGPA